MSSARTRDAQLVLVEAAITCFLERAGAHPKLILEKSVGTLVAGWVADVRAPAIWTTPLLIDEQCVADLLRATAPALLLAGTSDHAWDTRAADNTGLPIVLVDGADPGWATGQWRREMEVLGQVTEAVVDFARVLR